MTGSYFKCCFNVIQGNFKVIVTWQEVGTFVCFGTKDDSFGTFSMNQNGKLIGIKLVHTNGSVTCWPDRNMSNWGCGMGWGSKLFIAITDERNNAIYPPGATKEGTFVRGFNTMSKEIVLNDPTQTYMVNAGDTFRLWYVRDLFDSRESMTSGRSCANVFAKVK